MLSTLCVIQCMFQVSKDSEQIEGLAICSDADTPVTFVYPDGTIYTGEDIWIYTLHHYSPWMKFG